MAHVETHRGRVMLLSLLLALLALALFARPTHSARSRGLVAAEVGTANTLPANE